MLLIMCDCSVNRFAIDSREVSEVLPRANLSHLTGSPAWLAGMLVYRGKAIPVMDLTQLTAGTPCPNRFSSRIVVLQTELKGGRQRIGVLAERVGMRELGLPTAMSGSEPPQRAAWGTLHLDEQGVFQLLDIARLIPDERQAVLFPAAGKES